MTKAQHRIGPCSNCGNPHARHDYCDNCGHRDPLHKAMQADIDRLRAERDALRQTLSELIYRLKRKATAEDWAAIDRIEANLALSSEVSGGRSPSA